MPTARRLPQTLGARNARCFVWPVGSRCRVSLGLSSFWCRSCMAVLRTRGSLPQFIFMWSIFSRVIAGTLARRKVRVPHLGCVDWHLSLLACSPIISSWCDRTAITHNAIGYGASFRMACTLLASTWLLRRLGARFSVVGGVGMPRKSAAVSVRPNLSTGTSPFVNSGS